MSGSRSDSDWRPTTFADRGVSVPFTTPVLAGARIRSSPRGMELIVPQPAGVRGVYILPCQELGHFCPATLHDLRLMDGIRALGHVSPQSIRGAARAVAREGYAGRSAAEAARRAGEAEREAEDASFHTILRHLAAHVHGGSARPAGSLAHLAAMADQPPEQLGREIMRAARLFAACGIPGNSAARLPAIVAAMEEMAATLARWSRQNGGSLGRAAALVSVGTDRAARLGAHLLADAASCADLLPGLLGTQGATMADRLMRAEWALDGWESMVAAWRLGTDDNQRSVVSELALMMPPVPKEAECWTDLPPVSDGDHQALRHAAARLADWRTGALAFDLIARNENIRVLAA